MPSSMNPDRERSPAATGRMPSRALAYLLLVLTTGLFASGCGGSGCCGSGEVGGEPITEAPAFFLEDVNDTSATHGQLISPRAHLGRVSAWYFGQAT